MVELFDGKLQVFEYENGGIAINILKNEDGSYSFIEFQDVNEEDCYLINAKSFSCWEDGTQCIQTFHSNGNSATTERFGPDGSSLQVTYDETGNEIHSHIIERYTDGKQVEWKFEDGQLVYEKTVNPDGTYTEGICENGIWTYTEGVIEPTEPES